MFENHDGIRIVALHAPGIVGQDVHAALVVVGSCTFVALLVCEAFGEVETETIDMIFVHQIVQTFLDMLTERHILVIPVVEYAVWVRGIDIEPRIVGSCLVVGGIPVKLCVRMRPGCLIINDIHDYGHAFRMTFINELLVHCSCSVSLVKSEI